MRSEPGGDTAEAWGEIELPGLSRLREAVATAAHSAVPGRRTLSRDGLAGLNSALSSVPDGMASGLLVGVNPIYGLYACIAGPIAGGVFASTQLMIVATTSASALAAGQALGGLAGAERESALFLLVVLVGVFQAVAGLLRLGRLTRFVSYSVMTGFVIGIAVLTIMSQLPTVTGYQPTAGNRVGQTLELLLNVGQVDVVVTALAAITIALAVLLPRTPVGNLGTLVAIVVPSALVVFAQLETVPIVSDVGDISGGLPLPSLPSLSSATLDVITGALAVAAIVLIQGAGVSQSVPNPDGSPRRMSRDFVAQGAANVASGLSHGLPVGGSLSTTALVVLSGARSRWASLFAGVVMLAVVVVGSGVVAAVAMPALAAVLIVATASTIKPRDVRAVWQAGWSSRLTAATTFVATILLPIQLAVALGVVLSAIFYLQAASADVSVVELVELPDRRVEERAAPARLQSNSVTVLDVYGHLFFAGARTLARQLPRAAESDGAAVVLRLRGRTHVGATLVDVLSDYAKDLQAAGGRLYLSGIAESTYDEFNRAEGLKLVKPYKASIVVGESTQQAVRDAQAWLVEAGSDR